MAVLVLAADHLGKADALEAGVVLSKCKRRDVAAPFVTGDILAGIEQAGRPSQDLLVVGHPVEKPVRDILGPVVEGRLRTDGETLVVLAPEEPSRNQ